MEDNRSDKHAHFTGSAGENGQGSTCGKKESGVNLRSVHGAWALALGVPCGAVGAALMKHGSFGLSPFYTVSLALFQATGLWTMGTWNAIFQAALILTLILLLRRIKPRYLLSFAVAAVSSAILDGANSLCAGFLRTMPVRIG